jgi:hypothetical protein
MSFMSRMRGPLLYGVMQAAVTTGFATAIATHQLTGLGREFLWRWLVAWAIAWIMMLPVVVLLAPLLQRAVGLIVGRH